MTEATGNLATRSASFCDLAHLRGCGRKGRDLRHIGGRGVRSRLGCGYSASVRVATVRVADSATADGQA
ncbi:hypothetical protein FPZ47_21080 [Mycobacterium helveticum]|uniref:Uncharacterized protein n=1 Tax=Mycobacterium helveticum TaxID=2592811 RepID=A0A557XGL5_9MYCO|nr:hypothetical protein FPZ46_22085 [Mycobacterium helveticum]TVS84809.1 hypothetical protein FPZ47_21080 [Mycobacterium helveticum]